MTMLEQLRAEIEQARDRLKKIPFDTGSDRNNAFIDNVLSANVEFCNDLLQIIDKYKEQEPCRVKNELKVELNELEPCDDADAEYDKAYDAYLALVNADVKEPCDDVVSRQAVLEIIDGWYEQNRDTENIEDLIILITYMASVRPQEQTGHWSRKTKVDAYDIAGVKTWGIKCQCDKCDFTTIVVEDFGYYKYCPNCGARMVEPQESEEEE